MTYPKSLKSRKSLKSPNGFTLIELMIATSILTMLIVFSATIYNNFFSSVRSLKASNMIYEEARFSMERIVKEIRNGTIDYEEYFNQNPDNVEYYASDHSNFGKNYCVYSRQFYYAGDDGKFGTYDDESIGEKSDPTVTSAINKDNPVNENLFLININGDQRTYIKRFEETVKGQTIGRIGMVKLIGKDYGIDHVDSASDSTGNCKQDEGEKDGLIDTWVCADGFNCDKSSSSVGDSNCTIINDTIHTINNNSFIDITPAGLDIASLQFIIAPMDDPRKAYNSPEVQVQPHITIKMTARAHKKVLMGVESGTNPTITLNTTISARAYNDIITECNRSECTNGDGTPGSAMVMACPKHVGMLEDAIQECSNSVWPGCTTDNYMTATAAWIIDKNISATGLDESFPGGVARTYYEDGSEFASCDVDLADCKSNCDSNDQGCLNSCGSWETECKEYRCSDGQDNNADGLADSEDPNCVYYLCNNGRQDIGSDTDNPLEICTDVGGICAAIRPKEEKEKHCYDGYDNDCDLDNDDLDNTGADEFDSDCRELICSDNKVTPAHDGNSFIKPFLIKEDFYNDKDNNTGNFNRDDNTEAEDSGTPNSLNEVAPGVGGICGNALPINTDINETWECDNNSYLTANGYTKEACEAIKCSDGIDNDSDGMADELDEDYDSSKDYNSLPEDENNNNPSNDKCKEIICTNEERDCDLVGDDFITPNNLMSYTDYNQCPPKEQYTFNTKYIINDELRKNVGGVCDGVLTVIDSKAYDHTLLQDENVPISGRSSSSVFGNEHYLCTDGLDNDADGLIDWRDDNCCGDIDGDGFSFSRFHLDENASKTDMCQIPKSAIGTGINQVLVDCEKGEDASPDRAEVCGDSENIDNNCSFANNITISKLDKDDPSCCIDDDSDGYGAGDDDNKNYIYTDGDKCKHSALDYNNSKDSPDCNDQDKYINFDSTETRMTFDPGFTDSEVLYHACGDPNDNSSYDFTGKFFGVENPGQCSICLNDDGRGGIDNTPIDDNCDGKANHIDWYKDKDDEWFTKYANDIGMTSDDLTDLGFSDQEGIEAAKLLDVYDGGCCAGTNVIEICDDDIYGLGDGSGCDSG